MTNGGFLSAVSKVFWDLDISGKEGDRELYAKERDCIVQSIKKKTHGDLRFVPIRLSRLSNHELENLRSKVHQLFRDLQFVHSFGRFRCANRPSNELQRAFGRLDLKWFPFSKMAQDDQGAMNSSPQFDSINCHKTQKGALRAHRPPVRAIISYDFLHCLFTLNLWYFRFYPPEIPLTNRHLRYLLDEGSIPYNVLLISNTLHSVFAVFIHLKTLHFIGCLDQYLKKTRKILSVIDNALCAQKQPRTSQPILSESGFIAGRRRYLPKIQEKR